MRIRTVKPEFFLHDGLFDLEVETKMPMRVAFVGLWCAADREGRFKWEPRRLKAAILPYDDCDFSRVLDALTTRGYLIHYASGDASFGWIPSFTKHQVVNVRERASELPNPNDCNIIDACPTRAPRVPHAGTKEGNGKEGNGTSIPQPTEGKPKPDHSRLIAEFTSAFESKFGTKYQFHGGRDGKAVKGLLSAGRTPEEVMELAMAAWERPTSFWCQHATTLCGLWSKWNEIAAELRRPESQQKPKHRNGPNI